MSSKRVSTISIQCLPFPPAWFYAVIQMDPLAMVRDLGLDDRETLAAVKTLHPKKYLVYVDTALDLPMPNSKWCRYSVTVIGSTLCPEDRKNSILPDMVVPIFPNTQCSSDTRLPIRPLSDLPFPNCFHWIESYTYVRMRRHSTPFIDDSHAIRLDSDQDHVASWTFMQDYKRMMTLPSDPDSDDSSSIATLSDEEEFTAVPHWALQDPVVREACSPIDASRRWQFPMDGGTRRGPSEPEPSVLVIPSSNSSTHNPPSTNSRGNGSKDLKTSQDNLVDSEKVDVLTSAAEIFALNIFGWEPDPTFPIFPLVDLWFELEEHLTAESIPSPVEWFKEEKKINSILRDAFVRREREMENSKATTGSPTDGSISTGYDITSPQTVHSADSQADSETQRMPGLVEPGDSNADSLREILDETRLSRRYRFWSKEILREVRVGIRRLFRRTARVLCFRSLDSDLNAAVRT